MRFSLTLAIYVAVGAAPTQAARLTVRDAARVFAQADALCKADSGKLWGVSLCVPIMIVDPNTRQAFTNHAAPAATRDRTLFRLTLPANAQMSTAPFTYHGVRWAQLTWPLFGNANTQAVTLMHESFHVVQPRLGFRGNADNGSISGDAELDNETGRIWVRGEFRALTVALQSTGAARRHALRDAISMRLYRARRLPGTAQSERNLDLLEGLAESTGIDVALQAKQRIPYAVFDMAFVESQPSFARAFPYATGPAYSELLDAAEPRWRLRIAPSSDIARMAMRAYALHVEMPTQRQAQAIIGRYGGSVIEAQEAALAAHKAALAKTYTNELVTGPTLQLPLRNFNITFNPRDIETLAPYGSIYHTLRITAPWGTLVVSGGNALIPKDFKVVRIAQSANTQSKVVRGRHWNLVLSTGYGIVADRTRAGSFTVTVPR